jgi:hypothetical protein
MEYAVKNAAHLYNMRPQEHVSKGVMKSSNKTPSQANRRRYLITALTLICVLLTWLLWPAAETEPTTSQVIPETPPVVETTAVDIDQIMKENQQRQQAIEQVYTDNLSAKTTAQPRLELNADPTYLEAYRDWRYSKRCTDIIAAITNGEAAHTYHFSGLSEASFAALPAAQKKVFEQRTNRCLDLAHHVGNKPYPDVISRELRARFEAITPQKPNEIELKYALDLIGSFQQTANQLSRLLQGEHVDYQLFFSLNDERNALRRQYPQSDFMGGYSEADMDLVERLDQQMADIEQRIENNRQYDHQKIKELRQLQDQLAGELFGLFYQSNNSDVFLAINDLLNNNLFESETRDYEQQYGQQIIPKEYGQWLKQAVEDLHACELGHPCDEHSLISQDRCLDVFNTSAANACEQSVVDYYLNHLLSHNQMQDVEQLLTEWFK